MKRFLIACALSLAMAGSAYASVNLNRATEQQLQALHGVGPAKAHAIVVERQAHGPYRSLQDLESRVHGIGPATVTSWGTNVVLTSGTPTPPVVTSATHTTTTTSSTNHTPAPTTPHPATTTPAPTHTTPPKPNH